MRGGCAGLKVNNRDELRPTLRKALGIPGVIVIDIPTDFSKNVERRGIRLTCIWMEAVRLAESLR
jgi:thiamine pyrophosphate-dependent acetolactate synthase large subunit-like protein